LTTTVGKKNVIVTNIPCYRMSGKRLREKISQILRICDYIFSTKFGGVASFGDTSKTCVCQCFSSSPSH